MSFLDDIESDLENIVAGEFSEPAIIEVNSISLEIRCIYDHTYLSVDNEGATIQSQNPRIGVNYNNLTLDLGFELTENDRAIVYVGNSEYRIDHIEKDGTGYAAIYLKKK